MKKVYNLNISSFFWVFSGILFLHSVTEDRPAGAPDPLLDREIADKYGLTIPLPLDKNEALDPAPEWYRNAEMSSSDRRAWKDYELILKDTLLTRKVRTRHTHGFREVTEHYPAERFSSLDYSRVEGLPLISHVPHTKEAFEAAAEIGIRAIPYVHFTCIHTNYADQDVFVFQHPEILAKDSDGKWMNMPMDGSYRLHRFLTCANNPMYWKLSLAYVEKLMEMGADGLFIDNVTDREPCLAHRFDHIRNPEFDDSYITHEHLFPDATHDYAWGRMLQAIRALVKSYGEDKIVVLNPGIDTPVQNYGDGGEWESFIYSWAWEGRRHTWEDVKNRVEEHQWFLDAGRVIEARSFINTQREEMKEDAFWAYSAARLVGFLWRSNELHGTEAEILYQTHMGKPYGRFTEFDGIAHRAFENGIVVLNDNLNQKSMELSIPSELQTGHLLDIYNDSQIIHVNGGKMELTVPGKSARIYLTP